MVKLYNSPNKNKGERCEEVYIERFFFCHGKFTMKEEFFLSNSINYEIFVDCTSYCKASREVRTLLKTFIIERLHVD